MKSYIFSVLGFLFLSLPFAKAQSNVEYDDVYSTKEERYALAVLDNFEKRQLNNNRSRFYNPEHTSQSGKYAPRYDYYKNNSSNTANLYRNNYNTPSWGPTWGRSGSFGGWRSSTYIMGGMAMWNTPWSWYGWNTPMYGNAMGMGYDPYGYNGYYGSSMYYGSSFGYGSYYNGGGFYNPWSPCGYNPWYYTGIVRNNDAWRNSQMIRNPYGPINNDTRPEYYQTRTRENRDYRGDDNRSMYPGNSNTNTSTPDYRTRDSGGSRGGGTINQGGSGGTRTRRGG